MNLDSIEKWKSKEAKLAATFSTQKIPDLAGPLVEVISNFLDYEKEEKKYLKLTAVADERQSIILSSLILKLNEISEKMIEIGVDPIKVLRSYKATNTKLSTFLNHRGKLEEMVESQDKDLKEVCSFLYNAFDENGDKR